MISKQSFYLLIAVGLLAGNGCSLPEAFKVGGTDKPKTDKQLGQLKDPVKFTLSYARWQEKQGQMSEAAESYRLVLAESPDNLKAELGLARVKLRLGNLQEAEGSLKELLKRAPDDPEVLDSVAQLYAEKGEWPQALALLDQAVKLKPHDDTYRYHRAVALAEFGKIRESFHEFQKVLSESEACYNLAVIMKRKGDLQAADHFALKALEINPQYADAREFLNDLRSGAGSRYASHSSRGRQRATQPTGYQAPSQQQSSETYRNRAEYEEVTRGPFDE